jgi:hypothetical protein
MGKHNKLIGAAAVLGAAYVALDVIAKKQKADSTFENEPDQKNPFEGKKVEFIEDENDAENADGVRGHLQAVGDEPENKSFYDKVIKRGIDKTLAFGGLVALAPVFAVTSLAIKIEDPGPVLFTQKRVGENKKYFKLHNVVTTDRFLIKRRQGAELRHGCNEKAA